MTKYDDELPVDWGVEKHSEIINNHKGLSVVVHCVDWIPHCKYYLLAALNAAEELSHGKYKDDIKIILVNQEGAWKWAKHENVMIGTPITYFYYAGQQLKLTDSERDDAFVGALSSSLLVSITKRYVSCISRLQPGVDYPQINIPYSEFNLVTDDKTPSEVTPLVRFDSPRGHK